MNGISLGNVFAHAKLVTRESELLDARFEFARSECAIRGFDQNNLSAEQIKPDHLIPGVAQRDLTYLPASDEVEPASFQGGGLRHFQTHLQIMK